MLNDSLRPTQLPHFIEHRKSHVEMFPYYREHIAKIEPAPHRQYPPNIQELISSLLEARETVKDITGRLKSAQQECRRLELEWHRYSSTLSPIRGCPPEVLSIIFRLYLAGNPRRVRQLLLVCRQWHDVAIKDPQLWNRICIKVDEKQWDLKLVSESYEKHAKMCLQRSGASLLHVEIDCEELCPSRDQILERIKEPFAGQFIDGTAAEIAFSNWIDSLDVEELDIPAVTAMCQPKHIINAIKLVAGESGENMSRWDSLELILPRFYDTKVATRVWKLFKGPAPCLNRLTIMTCGFGGTDGSRLAGCFPNLQTLKHLHVDTIRTFRSLTLNPPSLESLVIYGDVGDWLAYDLSQFTHLQYLELHIYHSKPPNETTKVSLPLLKHLTLNGTLRHLGKIQFYTPILQDVNIQGRCQSDIDGNPDFLPGLQSSRVRWIGSNCTWEPWLEEKLLMEMKTILAHFHKATQLTVPNCAKNALIETLHLLHNRGELSDDLETIRFETRRGDVETMDVRTLLIPNSS